MTGAFALASRAAQPAAGCPDGRPIPAIIALTLAPHLLYGLREASGRLSTRLDDRWLGFASQLP